MEPISRSSPASSPRPSSEKRYDVPGSSMITMPSATELADPAPELALFGAAFALLLLGPVPRRTPARSPRPGGRQLIAGRRYALLARRRRCRARSLSGIFPATTWPTMEVVLVSSRSRWSTPGRSWSRTRPVQARSVAAGDVRGGRHDVADLRRQPGDGLPRAGDAGVVLVRAGRDRPRQSVGVRRRR